LMNEAYVGAGPPLGHGSHRYIFTIIALNSPSSLSTPRRLPNRTSKTP
jgi:phosphatidylethanolamine-binding protein (PEBP) family uncharacterized protein